MYAKNEAVLWWWRLTVRQLSTFIIPILPCLSHTYTDMTSLVDFFNSQASIFEVLVREVWCSMVSHFSRTVSRSLVSIKTLFSKIDAWCVSVLHLGGCFHLAIQPDDDDWRWYLILVALVMWLSLAMISITAGLYWTIATLLRICFASWGLFSARNPASW